MTDYSPEQNLAIAVIRSAVDDLQSAQLRDKEDVRAWLSAYTFFYEPAWGSSFEDFAAGIDLDVEATRERLKPHVTRRLKGDSVYEWANLQLDRFTQ